MQSLTSGLSAQVANEMRPALLVQYQPFKITHMGILFPFKKVYKLLHVSNDKQIQMLSHYISKIHLGIYYSL